MAKYSDLVAQQVGKNNISKDSKQQLFKYTLTRFSQQRIPKKKVNMAVLLTMHANNAVSIINRVKRTLAAAFVSWNFKQEKWTAGG